MGASVILLSCVFFLNYMFCLHPSTITEFFSRVMSDVCIDIFGWFCSVSWENVLRFDFIFMIFL